MNIVGVFLLTLVACRPPFNKDRGNGDDDSGKTDTDSGTETGDTGWEIPGEEVTPTLTMAGDERALFGAALDEGDINADGRDDLFVGAPGVRRHGDVGSAGPGMAYLLSGPLREDRAFMDTIVRFTGIANGDAMGTSVAHGDFNKDGVVDVVIGGDMPTSASPERPGLVAVAYGPFAEDVALSRAALFAGGDEGGALGAALAVGDFSSDGFDDFAAGAPLGLEGRSGAVVVYAGSAHGVTNDVAAVMQNGVGNARFGEALAMGDPTGDGVDDLLVGAPGYGAAYLFAGPIAGSITADDAERTYPEEVDGGLMGASVDLGDMTDDGYDDVLVGDPGHDGAGLDAGIVYVMHGPSSGAGGISMHYGEQPGSAAGSSVSFAHDVNNDGVYDMVVGAPGYDDEGLIDAGRGYLVLGMVEGLHSLQASGHVTGFATDGQLGATVLGDTDLTGDSIADYLFASPNVNDPDVVMNGVIVLMAGY